jgi:superfamily II DNA or RNA helicase
MPRSRPSVQHDEQLQLQATTGPAWPDIQRFPGNILGHTADGIIQSDLDHSGSPLLITSYTSLDRIIDFLANIHHRRTQYGNAGAAIVIGHEPSRTRRTNHKDSRQRFEKEISEYWLSEGISIARSAQVIAAIQCLAEDIVSVRTSNQRVIHAKLYVTDRAATLGSSNYSHSGMRVQAEANCRFLLEAEPDRYNETRKAAEAIWEEAKDYRAGLTALLRKLLKHVNWQEALGRACAELLEGAWAARYLPNPEHTSDIWPSQIGGIAQALWILDSTGSVLIADATGSGKTRMGAHLLRAVQVRRVRTGTRGAEPIALICPPAVDNLWRYETVRCDVNPGRYSSGALSHHNASARTDTIEAIRRASILAVDEAHNYLNRTSLRTQAMYRNQADHVILFTATPINRGTQDLLSIIDLLGADNFDDTVINAVQTAWTRRRREGQFRLSEHEADAIRSGLYRFTVRRTKSVLNSLVDREPEKYKNRLGEECRYPEHRARTYALNESATDRAIARDIREAARELKGLTQLRKDLRIPRALVTEGVTPQQYLAQRLSSARGLARYFVDSALRSSRAALLEHIRGTDAARVRFGIPTEVKKASTGNMIGTLISIRGVPPRSYLDVDLPSWLTDPGEHARACDQEIAIYEQIEGLLERLSDEREEAKTDMLLQRRKSHQLVLAFDTYLITLHDIKRRLHQTGEQDVLLATGENKRNRAQVQKQLGLGSKATGIALCSDALAEGVNLQGASVVAFLDMPSVVRIAEQRIGRIDRMDTPHKLIEVFWPDDAEEFALRARDLFLLRMKDVEDLLGSNIPLPPHLQTDGPDASIRVEEMQKILAHFGGDAGDGSLNDAFHSVRSLVEGESALVPPDVYRTVRRSRAEIRTAVSVLQTEQRWGFYAISAAGRAAPRWIYLDASSSQPVMDLDQIATTLRQRLSKPVERQLDEHAGTVMAQDLALLQQWEERTLPRRKQRALKLMRAVLRAERRREKTLDPTRRTVIRNIWDLCAPPPDGGLRRTSIDEPDEVVDLDAVADWWIDLIRPMWQQHLRNARRRRPARLADLEKQLIEDPPATDALETLFAHGNQLFTQPLARRVIAAIVGIPE